MKSTEFLHPSELNALGALPMLRRRGLGKMSLSSSFDHPDKARLETELNAYYYACGCSTSAKLLLLGIAAGLIYSAFGSAFQDMGLGNAALFTIGAGIAGAISGKLLGLYRAHKKLIKTVHTVQALWRPEVARETEQILCG